MSYQNFLWHCAYGANKQKSWQFAFTTSDQNCSCNRFTSIRSVHKSASVKKIDKNNICSEKNQKMIGFLGTARFRDELSLLRELDTAIRQGPLSGCHVFYRPHPWVEQVDNRSISLIIDLIMRLIRI